MPLGTLDRTAPPLFNQGPSALSRLIFFSALALFLMVADARFEIAGPLRSAISAVLYPLQRLAMQPVRVMRDASRYFEDLQNAQRNEDQARQALAQQGEQAHLAAALEQDNIRLRTLLELRQKAPTSGRAAEVLHDAADPYSRKVIIDQGLLRGVVLGSPVIDELGVLGQVTQVHPFTSEVTLVIDRDLSIPLQNLRTGARAVAYGDPTARGGGMELRFLGANVDVQVGDLLTTSGIDGVYPVGVPVAKVERVERRADSAFARIVCEPVARVHAVRYVMVLTPGEVAAEVKAPAPVLPEAGKKPGRHSAQPSGPGRPGAAP